MEYRVSLSDGIGVIGIILAVIIFVLDKAGKLKGGWLVWLLLLAGAMTLFVAIGNSWVLDAPTKWKLWRGILMFSLVAFVYSGMAIWISGSASETELKPVLNSHENREKPPTLSDLFMQDFANTLKAGGDLTLTREADGALIHIKRQVYMDFDAKTDFVGFYISSSDQFSDETFKICKTLVDAVQPAILDFTERKTQSWGGYRDQGTTSKELVFSGRVFLYHEGLLSITQKADLIKSYKAKNYDVQFRGLDYATDQAAAWYREHGFPKPDAKQP